MDTHRCHFGPIETFKKHLEYIQSALMSAGFELG